jgi:hypothetical protein
MVETPTHLARIAWSFGFLVLNAGAFAQVRSTAAQQFKSDVQPFLKTYCTSCHNPEKRKGKLTLHDISGNIVKETNASLWATVFDQIRFEEMPPEESKKQPNGKQRKAVMDWILSELGHAGFERDPYLLQRPEFGNHVNHERLFSGKITASSYSIPRVWRRRAELVRMGTPFPKSEIDYAAMQTIGEPETMRLRAISERIAYDLADFMFGRKKPHRNSRHNPKAVQVYKVPKLADAAMYHGGGAIRREHVEKDIQTLFATFLHRRANDAELKRYADFLEGMLKTESDREGALMTVMRAMVLTPESIYRMELGIGQKLPDGRRMLSEQELAIAVPMSLGRNDPIKGLKTRADVEKAVRSILQRNTATGGPGRTKRGITPVFMDFIRQYFGYHKATAVFKGSRHVWHHVGGNKNHTPPMRMVEETDQIVASILREDKDVFRRLLTFDQVIVSRRTTDEAKIKETFAYYKPDWRWDRLPIKKAPRSIFLSSRNVFQALSYMDYYGLKPTDPVAKTTNPNEMIKSPVPRAGVLTQPSWLVAHSTFTDNHVVLRGKWIREKLLGGSIPEVPVGVDAAIPEDDDKSLRERLVNTRQEFCWRCHHRMDPLGYPFEIYDDFGRYRSDGKERMINGQLAPGRVDTSGEIAATNIAGLDGPVKNAVEMIQKIAKTDRARQVFVRHTFRYFMGRNETLADSQSLIVADKAYATSGGSFKELVVSILTSDSFLYRKDPRAAKPIARKDGTR